MDPSSPVATTPTIPTIPTTPATVAPAADHVDGAQLLAVAEGNVERQPAEAVLAHLFSCEECTGHLHELRRGLLGLAAGPGAPPPADLADLEDTEPVNAFTSAVDDPTEARARRLIWKLALVGGGLGLGLWWLRGAAANLR